MWIKYHVEFFCGALNIIGIHIIKFFYEYNTISYVITEIIIIIFFLSLFLKALSNMVVSLNT